MLNSAKPYVFTQFFLDFLTAQETYESKTEID
jgi:hypothetical protein